MVGSETTASLGLSKSNADVRSPVTARRHGVMFVSTMPGYCLPKRRSMKRMSDVWSNTSESTSELPSKISFVMGTVERPCARDAAGVAGTM